MRSTYEVADAAMLANDRWTADKPWRVVWGFGAKQDFATLSEAIDKFESLSPGMLPVSPLHLPNRAERTAQTNQEV